ncbi:MAG: 4-hydroxy-3-methylbut-2-enyl diphosphate reductase [Pseudomonas sp.]|uniref:4-hydroxy-3-methylbut-2-enyl diphosphate reductase n=1 Tax=Pseudomonas sp. TaxID=306 RepID=UPI0011FC31D5|nr:4-hydroxy-3-methylbut-2-enyl diphosphate reductase [Pseudomonas sp.]RZI74704.1 MAG: 4-hydroxy-3-methylbut-2-enyl diphosphate reductase [Pseudomonas sp.]
MQKSTERASRPRKRVLLANPRGFCAGVDRAIETVERALARFGAPIYVRRAIVHNEQVVGTLREMGAVFVQEVDEIPEGAIAILSAHGSARAVKAAGQARGLRLVDAICPLVAKVHAEVETWYRMGRHTLLIGHQGHPEIVGTTGQVPSGAMSIISSAKDLAAIDLPANTAVAYAVQTTYAARDAAELVAAIQARFADCKGPSSSDICYATTNRQNAIEQIAPRCDLVIVAGDPTSSNASRLVEVASAVGCPRTRLVSDASEITHDLVGAATTIGMTAAASTPESLVTAITNRLALCGFATFEVPGTLEATRFKPVALEPLERPAHPGSLEERVEHIRKHIDSVVTGAIGALPGRSRRLADAMRYASVGRGKRFRALLVIAVSDLVGGSRTYALRIGAAIECVHAQSLIHDDLPCMDDDDLRRGQPTLHRKFDEATAILAGDALLALAFEILADPRTHPDGSVRAALVLALARAVGQDGLAGGQMMDLYPPSQPTRAELFACESRKTGALIRYAVEAGAMLGDCADDERERLARFAENLGLVFQIRDDVLDLVGDPATVGKAVAKDAERGRRTAATILGARGADEEAGRLAALCDEALAGFGAEATPLRELARFAVERLH